MRVFVGILLIAAASLAVQAQGSAKAATEIIASSEKIVKGAPFSAEAMSESLQVLADGNRITRTASNKMFRDSEGRFRRNGMTLLGAFYELHPTVIILDPVNGFKYYVNSESKTIRKVTLAVGTKIVSATGGTYTFQTAPTPAIAAGEYEAAAKKLQIEMNARQAEYAKLAETAPLKADLEKVSAAKALTGQLAIVGGVSGSVAAFGGEGAYKSKTEELGVQTIEGVPAEGTRTVTTIPAGAIGNERPIDIVYERWYSRDLQLIVSSKHSDPRFGDQIYRLTNITRVEPDNSLFSIPADYKMTFEPMSGFGTPAPGATGTSPTPGARVKPAPGVKPTIPPPPAPKPKTII